MRLDVIQFLKDYGIEYVDVGPNVKKGNVNIKCPWCGDDPSHHLGIEPTKGWYGCWRNPQHRGKNLARLLAAIAPISYYTAVQLVGKNLSTIDQNDFDSIADGSFFENPDHQLEDEVQAKELKWPVQFRKLRPPCKAPGKYYYDYLVQRGFTEYLACRICRRFDLHYCVSGRYKERILIPVYIEGQLVTWTSRSIYVNHPIPYLSLDEEASVINIKHCVYNYDGAIRGGTTLFLVEGPADVWKLDTLAAFHKCRAIGLFNMACEEPQQGWLEDLAYKYRNFVVLLDRNELVSSTALIDKLAYLPIPIHLGELPKGVKDPGELNEVQVHELCKEYFQ